MLFFGVSGAGLGLFASPAYPWGQQGHEIVAAIAETHLTDAARKRIKELLPQSTTLADVSRWPDEVGRKIVDMNPYHFVNFPKDANTYDQQRIASSVTAFSKRLHGICAYSAQPMRHETRSELHFGSSLISSMTSISRFMPGSPKTGVAQC